MCTKVAKVGFCIVYTQTSICTNDFPLLLARKSVFFYFHDKDPISLLANIIISKTCISNSPTRKSHCHNILFSDENSHIQYNVGYTKKNSILELTHFRVRKGLFHTNVYFVQRFT